MEPEPSSDKAPYHVCHLLIPNRDLDCFLAEALSTQVRQLPRVELHGTITLSIENTAGDLEECIGRQLGLTVHYVRFFSSGDIHTPPSEGESPKHHILLMNLCEDNPTIHAPLEWVGRQITTSFEWVDPSHLDAKTVVYEFFEEINERHWFTSKPWLNVNWFIKLTAWIREVLERHDIAMISHIRHAYDAENCQVLSCNVRTRLCESQQNRSLDDVLFIKNSCPRSCEGNRTVSIRSVVGDIAPEVIAVHEGDGTMIQRDAGSWTDESFDQEALINTIAKMQRLSAGRIQELTAAGVRVRDCEWLRSNIKTIFHHESLELLWNEDELFKEMLSYLRTQVGALEDAFRKIEILGLPNTLVHGDLGFQNIGSRRSGSFYCFFDWANSFVGHPLFDFQDFLAEYSYTDVEGLNYDTAVTQVAKVSMPNATLIEFENLMKVTLLMRKVIQIYRFAEQYDAKDDECGDHIWKSMKDEIALLTHFVECWLDKEEKRCESARSDLVKSYFSRDITHL